MERDPALCGHLNRDVAYLCGLLNFKNKSCVSCACLFRCTLCSYLEFDLILGVIPSDLVATSCSLYLYILYSVLLASCKLIRS
jgi:hypothetical protein